MNSDPDRPGRVYKLLSRAEWASAVAIGRFEGSAADRADGFIHLSTADQAPETARRHFSGRADLLLLTIDARALGPALAWEVARGGALFPHLYGPLIAAAVLAVAEARPGADGAPVLPDLA